MAMHYEGTDEVINKRSNVMYARWREHFSAWKEGDQTEEAYCAAHNLSVKAFKKQYLRYKRELFLSSNPNLQESSAKNFAPVKLIGSSVPSAIELIFRSGVVMKIPSSVSLPSILNSLEAYL
jgi:hypothetical protein